MSNTASLAASVVIVAFCSSIVAIVYWQRFKIYLFFCHIADIFCDAETIAQRKNDRQWFLTLARLSKDKWVDSRYDENGFPFFHARLANGESATLRRKYMGTVEICADLVVCSMPVEERVVHVNILDMSDFSVAGDCYYYRPRNVERKNCRLVDFLYDKLASQFRLKV